MKTSAIDLPSEAPVMLLPGTVLFPNSILPLRIFEPRYRAMLEWALERDRMFCVALMKPGITEAETDDDFFHTAGIGLVAASVTQADGTSNLMLHGLGRMHVMGFSQREPFRIATVVPRPDFAADSSQTEPLVEKLRVQCRAIRVNGAPLPSLFTEAVEKIEDPAFLSDTIASSLVNDPGRRQRFLEEQNPAVRLLKLTRYLGREFPQGESA